MPTYGDPNTVGFKMTEHERPSIPKLAAAGVLGYGGAKVTGQAIRPNVAGRIKRAEAKVTEVDTKIANKQVTRSPAQMQDLARERLHTQRMADTIRRTLPTRQTPKLRVKRGIGGLAMLGAAGYLAMPRKKKVVDAYMG